MPGKQTDAVKDSAEEEMEETVKDNRKWFMKGSCIALVISPIILILIMGVLYAVWLLVN